MRSFAAISPIVFFFLIGCAGPNINQYRADSPTLDVRNYFNGDLDAWGVVKDRSGNVTRRFNATIKGHWSGAQGTLDERFYWSDGKQQSRVWTLTMRDDQHFSGTAADVIGASAGRQVGSAVHMQYVLRVPLDDGGSIDLTMDDWMYQVTENELINETTMYKFGVRVGSILIGFRKR